MCWAAGRSPGVPTAAARARSAWLTSPTFGALSWLAHATLQTGLWVDSQDRYDLLVDSPRTSLSELFGRAGWRTVASVPANTEDWPEGAFYGFDHAYDSRNVGYRGPRFGYPTMPDQFTLETFWRRELAPRDGRFRVLYGRTTDEAKQACDDLKKLGVDVGFLAGGFLHWEADGLGVER